MKIAIVVIGDEILLGNVTDTNSGFIARTIDPLSWQLSSVMTVGDDPQAIRTAIYRGLAEADAVITTGGLGPTRDDITKRVLCEMFGCGLRHDKETEENVVRVLTARGREVNELSLAQALVPEAATVIRNNVGTAPIMWFDHPGGKVVVCMPGVPFETEQMLVEGVLPRLINRFTGGINISHRSVIATTLSESAIAEKLADFEDSLPDGVHLAYLPKPGYVHLRLDGSGPDQRQLDSVLDREADRMATILGQEIVAARLDLSPEQILLKTLTGKQLTIATAESCTGGNIAHRLTLIPGSSEAVQGGVVSYSNSVKVNVLGVDPGTIESLGAVSEEVAAAMAEGACRTCGADIGVATSGIAGPGGGTPRKPVGTVCIAVAIEGKCVLRTTLHLRGSRQRIIDHASTLVLLEANRQINLHI